MSEIRLASEQLAALKIVEDLFRDEFPTPSHAHDMFRDACILMKPVLQQRAKDDTLLGEAAHAIGLPSVRTSERTGAMIRAAAERAGIPLAAPIVDAEIADE